MGEGAVRARAVGVEGAALSVTASPRNYPDQGSPLTPFNSGAAGGADVAK